jgi:hypothetical protein
MEADEGMCCGGQLNIAMPFTGSGRNAAAIWGPAADVAYAEGTYYTPRLDDVAFRAYGNVGGLNPDVNPQPYYDPRGAVTLRAPTEISPDGLISTPSLAHGPVLWEGAPIRPRTQYAPQGDLLAEPLALDVSRQPCICACVLAYSLTSLMLAPWNVATLRAALLQAGLVTLTPALAALTAGTSCGCRLLGGAEGGVYAPFAAYAQQYTDVPIMTILEPARQAAFATQVYVTRFISTARAGVTAQAQMNYARAEGPRAQLQAYPQPDCSRAPLSTLLPPILPGTGVAVVATDTLFATRALTDPRSAVTCREALSCRTGLPIGAAPVWYPAVAVPTEAAVMETELMARNTFERAAYTAATSNQTFPFQL